MKLTDPWFEAEFYGKARGVAFTRQGSSIEGAQGLFLWCPCGYGKRAAHGIIVPFANPRNAPQLPPVHGPQARDGSHRPRWSMAGSELDDLTLSPSVDVGEPSCWHGFIVAGEVR